jgi:hypothetical protein
MRRYLENPDLISLHSKAALAVAMENHNPDINCEMLFRAVEE